LRADAAACLHRCVTNAPGTAVDGSELEILRNLGVALAVGLLIGVERGWHQRLAPEGSRVAGMRTFGLIGLIGGLAALVGRDLGGWFATGALAVLAAGLIVARWQVAKVEHDMGMTTVVAALITFCLGALAMEGRLAVAAAAAVVTALLLGLKPTLHRWLQRIEERELLAALQLLLISVVVLPVLPDEGFGPYAALNPYQIWWMVVLIAGLSFAGYVAVRLAGTGRGIVLTGVFGGLASSTAVTLTFARFGRRQPALQGPLATGVILAWTVMYARMAVLTAVVAPALLARLILPLGLAAAVGLVAGLLLLRRPAVAPLPEHQLTNPFEFAMALRFGALLAVVLLVTHALRDWLGDAGLLAVAFVSGLTDVDAITLTVGKLTASQLAPIVAVEALLLAAGANTLVKAAMVVAIAGGVMARWIVIVFGATLVAAGLGVWLSEHAIAAA
jgi:uncharacterized membrane protein (DUF4010 family)